MEKPVVVVGAGLGGLAAAIRLRLAGRPVTVCERLGGPGGKCNVLRWEGYHFDTGPSLLTMPGVLADLFAAAGERMEDHLQLERLEPACRYFFAGQGGGYFDAPGTLEGWEEAVRRHFPEDLEGWRRFRGEGRRLWEISAPLFLYNRPGLKGLWEAGPGKALAGLSALRPQTMDQALRGYFRDPRLLQIYRRFATYNGSDPARTPATFQIIPWVEAAQGGWHVRGGLFRVVEALAGLAGRLGVELRYGCPVKRILFSTMGRAAVGVEVAEGELGASEVVVNADAVGALTGDLCAGLAGGEGRRRRWARREASGSGFVGLYALEGQVEGLACHNIFFCADYGREFREIFGPGAGPLGDPTIYLHAASRIDPGLAPAGGEGWFVLVNAPSLDRFACWEEERYGAWLTDHLLVRLAEAGVAFDPGRVRGRFFRSPRYFQEEYGAWRGALYGTSSNRWEDAFFRVNNAGPARGLYFCGGSAHPGGGIPLVLLSGKLAAEAVLAGA